MKAVSIRHFMGYSILFFHRSIFTISSTVTSIYRLHILKYIAGSPIRRHFRRNKCTPAAVLKTSLLQKQIKNHPTLAYKNSVRKCYQDVFFITNMQFNNPTSMPQT